MSKTDYSTAGDLFGERGKELLKRHAPLADRMRPRNLDEFIGQKHIIGSGRLLRRAIQIDQLSSLIFYGPPGTGKTTLARIIANTTKAHFISINAVLAGVKDIRTAIEKAREHLSLYGKRTILFIDEVHRFNKSQQDALLPHVESGVLTLIGATTENPYFEVNKALVSRSRIFQLQPLSGDELKAVARQALEDPERGYGNLVVRIDDDALEHLVKVAGGDARGVLNALELAVETTGAMENGTILIDRSTIEDSIQQRAVLYDKDGDAHYDTVSAFIKSVRGSDPDAALYWMAKMLYAGEDPRFIFRRMLILAGEDVGMADPHALGIVVDAARSFDYVGLPEGRYHLAHACLYLATAPKSNSSMAFFDAISAVAEERNDDVPDHLKDASRDSEELGHGAGYLYPHAYRDHWVAQQYLPEALQGKLFYQPSDQGYENKIAEQVARRREAQIEAMVEADELSPLSTGDANSLPAQQRWIARSLDSRGTQLGQIREQLFALCALKPSDLVLDLNTRTGMITMEAVRHIREGGVWALAHSQESFSTVRKMADRIPPLIRPVIVSTGWETFEKDLLQAAGETVCFTKIIGRGVLTCHDDKKNLVCRIRRFLDPGGTISLAETVPSSGQRLSQLIDYKRMATDDFEAFIASENDLYSDPCDPMVNWTASSLRNLLNGIAGLKSVYKESEIVENRTIRPEDIDFWFRTAKGTDGRLSLGDRCGERMNKKSLELLRRSFHEQLDHTRVQWRSVHLFIHISQNERASKRHSPA